jgi:fibronectin type III domain-containing protein 3
MVYLIKTHRLDNLNPGTEYSVRLAAVPAGEGGTASGTAYASFTTQPAAPSTPSPPRLAGRTKTSLTLKWSSCPNGGSPLTAYLLEVADNPEGDWRPLYKGREKQYVAAKLQPGTTYCFR